MTPPELADAIQLANVTEFGPMTDQPAEQFPHEYFDYSVVTIAPNGQTTARAPKYCATNLGASQLASIFIGWNGARPSGPIVISKMVLDNAMVYTGLVGGWSDNKLVPWLEFVDPNGLKGHVNCGVLLDYFNHGEPATIAWANVQQEVNSLVFTV